ncbi:uncharacterized protein [Battus philenor]|uniref:uncharacterized protein n=1 Tax=Battus philenor TaxID=42288 RepID=UPI0035CF0912
MGTRSSAKIKLRNAPYKCDLCCRRLMSAEALKTHQICIHNLKVKTKTLPNKQAVVKAKSQLQKVKNERLEKIIVKSKIPLQKKVNVSSKADKTTVKNPPKLPEKPPSDSEKCIYECPKCQKTFRIYFSAHRHIQKSHCVNSSGEKVSPNSPNLIKPIVRSGCVKCNKRLDPLERHLCDVIETFEHEDLGLSIYYVCTGCKQQFLNLRVFDLHVSGLHCDGVESMFFPNSDVFQAWKNDMEEQTKVKYSILGKYNHKKMFRCTHLPEENNSHDDSTSFLCPSAIVVQEFSKGIQVHFYKNHFGHDCGDYVSSDDNKKYSLTTLLNKAKENTEIEDFKVEESDLYIQFKQLMECIVHDAAKTNIDTLKVLIGKALEMTSVVNSYGVDLNPDTVSTKSSIDNNIKGVLGELGNSLNKKKKTEVTEDNPKSEPITKRFKTRINQLNPNNDIPIQSQKSLSVPLLQDTSIKIINSFSLAEQDISKAVNEMDSDENEESKKEDELVERASKKFNLSDEIKIELENEVNNEIESPSLFDSSDPYKKFVVRNFKLDQNPSKLKNKSKSISGNRNQVNKSPSPKSQSHTKDTTKHTSKHINQIKSETGLSSLPVDYKYEVKERENDCNILILKI